MSVADPTTDPDLGLVGLDNVKKNNYFSLGGTWWGPVEAATSQQ